MRLSIRERRKLRRIDAATRRGDPRLAGVLTMFAKLAADEAMPGHERLSSKQPAQWDSLMRARPSA